MLMCGCDNDDFEVMMCGCDDGVWIEVLMCGCTYMDVQKWCRWH